jgi:hypothetical protein
MSESAASEVKNERGVLCHKCEHLNPLGLTECERCGRGLFAACPKCRQQNQRGLSRCPKCQHHLHRSVFHSRKKRPLTRARRDLYRKILIWGLQGVAILGGMAVAYKAFQMINSSSGGGGE